MIAKDQQIGSAQILEPLIRRSCPCGSKDLEHANGIALTIGAQRGPEHRTLP